MTYPLMMGAAFSKRAEASQGREVSINDQRREGHHRSIQEGDVSTETRGDFSTGIKERHVRRSNLSETTDGFEADEAEELCIQQAHQSLDLRKHLQTQLEVKATYEKIIAKIAVLKEQGGAVPIPLHQAREALRSALVHYDQLMLLKQTATSFIRCSDESDTKIQEDEQQSRELIINFFLNAAQFYQFTLAALESASDTDRVRYLEHTANALFHVALEAQKQQPAEEVMKCLLSAARFYVEAIDTLDQTDDPRRVLCLEFAAGILCVQALRPEERPSEKAIALLLNAAQHYEQADLLETSVDDPKSENQAIWYEKGDALFSQALEFLFHHAPGYKVAQDAGVFKTS